MIIAEILKKKLGLNVNSIGQRKFDADVMHRMRQCGVTAVERYGELLRDSPEELDRLIEMVTIPETWFFRLKNAFDYFSEYVRGELMRHGLKTMVRVLSFPCASGEEPYSIAMIVKEIGLSPENFVIDAADINGMCLARARDGIYTRNSFRGECPGLIEKYFIREGNFFSISPEIKETVRFFRRNLLEYIPPEKDDRYDVIFCRNMLIYLDEESQRRAVAILARALKDNGILFVGHSESGILMNSGFSSVKINGCFAFRKSAEKSKPPPPPKTEKKYRPPVRTESRPAEVARKRVPPPEVKAEAKPEVKPELKHELLLRAEQLADSGDLIAAEEMCRGYLSANKLDARGYFLLGIVLLSSRRHAEAEEYFRKALYLDPGYQEALLSMAVIRDRVGDKGRAASYRERVKRTNERGEHR